MIDLHCHLLPGIDDGAVTLEDSLEMARIAVADGITTTACTPHIYPVVFENTRDDILRRVRILSNQLAEADIPLTITSGADIQVVPELIHGLHSGRMATLNDTRYFLFEPPHYSIPTGFLELISDSLSAGYVPIITHPERLTWLDQNHYTWFVDAAAQGAWIQLTAGALTGRFGKTARTWSERFLGDGLVHILATDAHDRERRPPRLSEGLRAAEKFVGAAEAARLVLDRPLAVLKDQDPISVKPPPAFHIEPEHPVPVRTPSSRSLWGRLFGI